MSNIGFQYNHLDSTSNIPQVENAKVDELMISNMISVLNNPTLVQMLDEEELKALLHTVKNHVVMKSKRELELQSSYLTGLERNKFR